MLKKLRKGLILLLLIDIACVKPPVSGKGEIYSVLFSFSASVNGKSYSSLRVYINSDLKDKISISVLLPTNKLVANVYYDGERLIVIDYNRKVAYIDNKKKVNLEKWMGFKLPLNAFKDFFNNCYLQKKCNYREVKNYKMIVNAKKEIVILEKKGNVLLKPLSKIVKGKMNYIEKKIPKGFEVMYVKH